VGFVLLVVSGLGGSGIDGWLPARMDGDARMRRSIFIEPLIIVLI